MRIQLPLLYALNTVGKSDSNTCGASLVLMVWLGMGFEVTLTIPFKLKKKNLVKGSF